MVLTADFEDLDLAGPGKLRRLACERRLESRSDRARGNVIRLEQPRRCKPRHSFILQLRQLVVIHQQRADQVARRTPKALPRMSQKANQVGRLQGGAPW